MTRLGPFGQEHLAHHDLLDEGSRDPERRIAQGRQLEIGNRAQAALYGAHGQRLRSRFGYHGSRALPLTRLFGMHGRQRAQDGQRDDQHADKATLLTHVRSRGTLPGQHGHRGGRTLAQCSGYRRAAVARLGGATTQRSRVGSMPNARRRASPT